jgi:acetyl esterase/lipase
VLFGNSAGGHLAMAAGLALSEGKFTDIISAQVLIRGIVACYPANGLSETLGIPGTQELVWPETMVSPGSPALLLLHGTHDAMAPISISIRIRDRYLDAGNPNAYLLVLPLAGHSPDLHYSGIYNQVWLYFLEGFLEHILE